MSKRWILRLVLSIMLLAALSAAVCATDEENWYDAEQQEYFWEEEQLETVFPDVAPGSWYYDDVMYLYRNGIIGGFPDGTFRPEDKVTTGQALKMIILAAGYAEPEQAASHWARGYLNFALETGMLERGEITDLDISMSRHSDREGCGARARRSTAGSDAEIYRYKRRFCPRTERDRHHRRLSGRHVPPGGLPDPRGALDHCQPDLCLPHGPDRRHRQ